ncbi:RNA polymerase sigma-70 factor (ECF subfamily) [Wenyingzhuangia heitensis]|uniref:RNA polymerase sigma-70 factor (ECF subfamily) n=1 Tax=Wenyingzhuangia heitensis TaxID=1487859 RepID=A0ABX0U8W1_9FLAO|nr:RNA polymerase sigma-70 factor (ECF subfamily) [Wenyingzhuangia heitensis]
MHLKKIIKQCQQNNSKAQASLYKLFAAKLYAVSYKYSNNKQEAEDNLHDGFLTILQKIDQFKHQGSFEGWMKRIVINTALEKYRKDKVFPLINEEIKDEITVEINDDNLDLETLLQSIQKLPNRYTDWFLTSMF